MVKTKSLDIIEIARLSKNGGGLDETKLRVSKL
jgi:hypothetical protein